MGPGRGRAGRSLDAALTFVLGLGSFGVLAQLQATSELLVGAQAARTACLCFVAALGLGAALGGWLPLAMASLAPLPRRLLGGLFWLLVVAAGLSPGLLATADLFTLAPGAWLAVALLAGGALGGGLGRVALGEASTWAAALLGGAVGMALPELLFELLAGLSPGAVLRRPGLLLGLAGLTTLGLAGLGLRDLARGMRSAEEPRPGEELPPLRPRLAGLYYLSCVLLGATVLWLWSGWTSLAPQPPVPGSLGLATCAGLGLGALLLGRPLRNSRLAGCSIGIGLGLAWLLLLVGADIPGDVPTWLGAGPDTGAASELLAASLFHLRFLGPLLLTLGAVPIALGAQVQPSGFGRRRGQLACWLLPLGLLALEAPAAALAGEPMAAVVAGLGLLLVLLFLAADLPSPGVGAALGPLRRGLPIALRGLALASLAAALHLATRTPLASPLSAWHAPAEVAGIELLGPGLELLDPTTGAVLRRTSRGWSQDTERTTRLLGLAEGLAQGLQLPVGPTRRLGPQDPQDPIRPGDDLRRVGAGPSWSAVLVVPAPGDPAAFRRERLAALAGAPASGGVVISHLPVELDPASFNEALSGFAGAHASATAWFVEDEVFLLGAAELPTPDLEVLDQGLALLARFVAVLPATRSAGDHGRGLLELAERQLPVHGQANEWRRRARNLEHLFGRATPLPAAWGPLLGGVEGPMAAAPALQAGRHLRMAHLAHAWVNHHAAAAPGSLAMETWSTRLEDSLLSSLVALPGLPAANELFELAEAEAGVRRGFELLEAGEPIAAIPFLIRSTQRWPERGDLALGLATALELAGNRSAARVVLRDLGATRTSLFRTEVGQHLFSLGLDPELVLSGDE